MVLLAAALLLGLVIRTPAQQPARAAAGGERELTVAVVVWEGVALIEVAAPLHVFTFAKGFRPYAIGGESVLGVRSHGVDLKPDGFGTHVEPPDVVVVPGGGHGLRDENVRGYLRHVVPRARVVLAICNGIDVLAAAGLLDGRTITGPDGDLDEAAILGKDVRCIAGKRWHRDGNLFTTASYTAAFDGALAVLAHLRGEEEARRVAELSRHAFSYPEQAADPGRPYVSGRELVFRALLDGGLDAALARHASLPDEPALTGAPARLAAPDESHYRELVTVLLDAGRAGQALPLARFVAAQWPDSPRARAHLGEVLLQGGRHEEALAVLREAAAAAPGDRFVLERLQRAEEAAAAAAPGADGALPAGTSRPDGSPAPPPAGGDG